MDDTANLFPPMQYQAGWALMAVSLILLLIIFYIVVLRSTRKLKPEPLIVSLPRVAGGEERLSLIKNKYVKKVQEIQEAYHEGDISSRKAFQALSINLRNFTHEYSRSGAHAMTLTDLHKYNAPEFLRNKIRDFYPLAFEEAERTGNVDLAVNDVLQVIALWR